MEERKSDPLRDGMGTAGWLTGWMLLLLLLLLRLLMMMMMMDVKRDDKKGRGVTGMIVANDDTIGQEARLGNS